jgi:predicted 3-demethylubiquinone-9 3-methyltransferase (glyoxalase superfamily)
MVAFNLHGQHFTILNGGPQFKFTPAISLYVVCRTAEEANLLWSRLVEGGSTMMPLQAYPWSACYGWLADKYGLHWQVALHTEEDFQQKISPAMVFMGNRQHLGEESIRFYTSLFPNSRTNFIAHFEEGEQGGYPGSLKFVMYQLNGQTFVAMGNSHQHAWDFNEAVSFQVACDTQDEIDHYWNAFANGGTEEQCGWVRDRFGVWWQVFPAILPKLLADKERAGRVMLAFMQMQKFDLDMLLKA